MKLLQDQADKLIAMANIEPCETKRMKLLRKALGITKAINEKLKA